MKIIFATANPHKVQEVNEIAKGSDIEFVLPNSDFNPIEDGETFLENAYKKAKAALDGEFFVLADDSGLCVDALGGAPGLYSARYAGSQDEKIDKLLNELDGVDERSAKFVCAMVLLDKSGEKIFETMGECRGKIAKTREGINGFGYDPIFIADGYDVSIATLSEDEKNKISHRGCALQNVIQWLLSRK